MGQFDPNTAIQLVVNQLPLVVVVLLGFWLRLFRLGKDVEEEKRLLNEGHKREIELLTGQRDEYKSLWEEEKRDRLAITDRITPLTETVRDSAGLIERTVQIAEGLLDEQSSREALRRTRRSPPRRSTSRSRRSSNVSAEN